MTNAGCCCCCHFVARLNFFRSHFKGTHTHITIAVGAAIVACAAAGQQAPLTHAAGAVAQRPPGREAAGRQRGRGLELHRMGYAWEGVLRLGVDDGRHRFHATALRITLSNHLTVSMTPFLTRKNPSPQPPLRSIDSPQPPPHVFIPDPTKTALIP